MQLDLFENNYIKEVLTISQIKNEKTETSKTKKSKNNIPELKKIKNNFFYQKLEENFKRYQGDIDFAEKMTFLEATVIKSNSIVNYSIPYKKRFNTKSLDNLNNVNQKKTISKSHELKKKETIKNVQSWANKFKDEYKKEHNKEFTGLLSKTTTSKINKLTTCFTRSLFSKYNNSKGFNQRTITFCTFTISENQKHSDEFITKHFVDFIDHLKKVKNYIINPITKERTKNEAFKLKNYVWRSETQENGNIHFHLIADTFLNQDMLRRVWNNYLKKMGYKYSYSSANVQSLKKDKKTKKIKSIDAYLCKYMTKAPLRNKFKYMTRKELKRYPENEIYRRPIIAKSWGCSKELLTLEFPTFYAHEANIVFSELKQHLKKLVSETLPEYITVLIGNTKTALRNTSYLLQKAVKQYYIVMHEFLYQPEIILN